MKRVDILPGAIVKHCKGRQYILIGVGLHTETEEPLVIYTAVDDPNVIWARPLEMFLTPGRFKLEEKP